MIIDLGGSNFSYTEINACTLNYFAKYGDISEFDNGIPDF
jgi:hypothetical protein